MPNLDKTGPQGVSPMTGRGMGPCGGGTAYGRGAGRGFGRGRGFCRWFGFGSRQLTKTEEAVDTKSYIEDLKAELSEAEKYLKDLEGKK